LANSLITFVVGPSHEVSVVGVPHLHLVNVAAAAGVGGVRRKMGSCAGYVLGRASVNVKSLHGNETHPLPRRDSPSYTTHLPHATDTSTHYAALSPPLPTGEPHETLAYPTVLPLQPTA
jgi:hypothetical protein